MNATNSRDGIRAPTAGPGGLALSPLPRPLPLQKAAADIRLGTEKDPWTLIVGPRSLNVPLLGAIASLGALGPVRVLDGGNRFNAYVLARAARGQPQVLDRITASRAFTCYQVLSLLESTPAIQVASAEVPRIVILDLLNTFYDESVHLGERKRLLRACLVQLERLAPRPDRTASLPPASGPDRRFASLISVHPPAVGAPGSVELLQMLEASLLIETFFVRSDPSPPEPLKLF